MGRLPRVVVPGLLHHVTQRGNRRQQTFFGDEDYAEYRRLLPVSCRKRGTEVLAYCLMLNHVHLILVPADNFGLRDALAEAHRRYTARLDPDWEAFVGEIDTPKFGELLHAHASTGRALGPDSFAELLERRLGCPLKRRKPGPKPKGRDCSTLDLFENRYKNKQTVPELSPELQRPGDDLSAGHGCGRRDLRLRGS